MGMTERRARTGEALGAGAAILARLLQHRIGVEAEAALTGDKVEAPLNDGHVARLEALAKAGRAIALFDQAIERRAEKAAAETTRDEGMNDRAGDPGTDGDSLSVLERKYAEIHRRLDEMALLGGDTPPAETPDWPPCGGSPAALVGVGQGGTEAA